MITIKEPFVPEHFYSGICPKGRNLLFFDIETTGFSRKYHQIYLIGAAACLDGSWNLFQWLAQTPEEEAELIHSFLDFSRDYDTLIHFNGTRFDLPFLEARARARNLSWELSFQESIDLMEGIRPYKTLCQLENCKQKSIEKLLGLSSREDTMTGGELIPVYREYVKNPNEEGRTLLLLHNADDVRCMTGLTQIGLIHDFFHGIFRFTGCIQKPNQLTLSYENALCLPFLLNHSWDYWDIRVKGNRLSITIPVLHTTMKHFYKNYRDYYYLPDEDMVVHKSIARFVDKGHRQKATRQNCCIKQTGSFLPQPGPLILPDFVMDLTDSITFLPETGWQEDPAFAERYLQELFSCYLSAGK